MKSGDSIMRKRLLVVCAAATLTFGQAVRAAPGDDVVNEAKAAVATATGPQTQWLGPTSGPAAPADKHIVFISCGGFNEICVSVGKAVTEAAGKVGWKVTTIDEIGRAHV